MGGIGSGRIKVRPARGEPGYHEYMEARRAKRKQREAKRIIHDIHLSPEDARQRVSATSLSKELGLPVAVVKGILPRRKMKGRNGSQKPAKNTTITLGRAVRLMNEDQSATEVLLKSLKP